MKKFTIQVKIGDGIPGSDTEHIVKVIVEEDGINMGQIRLAAGNFENAKKMAYGLKRVSDGGTDLQDFLPNPEPCVQW